MVTVLPRAEPKNTESTSDRFANAFSAASRSIAEEVPKMLEGKQRAKQDAQEAQNIRDLTGMDVSGLSPDMRKIVLQASLKKKEEDISKFATGIDVIDKMREIASRRNIGRGSSLFGFFPGETAKDRAEYEQLGKSLIPLVAAGVPVRNQKEFEEYKKTITNPSASLSEIEGALDGLERIFMSKLSSKEEEGSKSSKEKEGKIKFNPSNPEHVAKRNQLMKTFNGDRQKVGEKLSKEFEL